MLSLAVQVSYVIFLLMKISTKVSQERTKLTTE